MVVVEGKKRHSHANQEIRVRVLNLLALPVQKYKSTNTDAAPDDEWQAL